MFEASDIRIERLNRAHDINVACNIFDNYSGCRFITLDAKRNPDKRLDSIHSYRKMRFKVLKERIKGTTPMYFDVDED